MGIGRSRPIRVLAMLATVALLAAASAQPASADAGGVVEVYPTGFAPYDQLSVQAAVDGGGTVLLKATAENGTPRDLDFTGLAPAVLVRRSTRIVGETLPDGRMTTTSNGRFSFYVIESVAPGAAPESDVTVEGIRFLNPRANAVWARVARSVTIRDCRIEAETMEGRTNLGPFGPIGVDILVGSSSSPTDIRGPITIADNVVDLEMAGGPAYHTFGISVMPVHGDIRISGNEVRGTTVRGIDT